MLLIQYIKNVCSSFSDCGYKHPKVKTGTTLVKCGFKKLVLSKVMTTLCPIPALPSGTRPMQDQVAGHKYSDGKLGCLQHEDGTLLKPVQCPPKGQREVNFYSAVFDPQCKDKMVLELHNYIPAYYGLIREVEVSYLKLENLLLHMSKPCVLDIKMGKVTYDPEATKEKMVLEIAKFPPLVNLGYQLSGMQIYNPRTKEMVKYDKYYCKKLTEDTIIPNGLGKFFSQDEYFRVDIIDKVIDRLKSIETWFSNQRHFAFYASSILIVFDGELINSDDTSTLHSADISVHCDDNTGVLHSDKTENSRSSNKISDEHVTCDQLKKTTQISNSDIHNSLDYDKNNRMDYASKKGSPRVEVRMIDFTHVFQSQEEDANYLFGLRNLIKHLQILKNSHSTS